MSVSKPKAECSSASSHLKACLSFTLGLTFFLLLHLLLIWAWLPMVVFRRVAIATSKYFVPGLGKPLSWRDMVLVENHNERHRLSLVGVGTLRGDISLATIQPLFESNLIEDRIEGSDGLQFPELQQFQTNVLGFRFWKDDPTFRPDNHFSEVVADEPDTPSYLKSYEGMVAELSGRAYPPQRSPWELIVVRGFQEADGDGEELNTVVIFRAHHSLMDATSGVHLLNKFFRGRSPVVHIPQAKTSQRQFRISDFLSLSALAGFFPAFLNLQLQVFQNLRTKRLIGAERRRKQGGGGVVHKDKVNFKLTSKLPLDKVKEVAASLGVRVPSLLSTLIAENLGRVLPSGVNSLNALYAMPLPKHPGSIVNHAYCGLVELPLCRTERIQSNNCHSINDIFLKLRFDPSILVLGYLSFIVGNCPAALVALINPYLGYYPIAITNFALGSKGFDVEGVEVVDVKGAIGTHEKITDCVIVSLGFKSHIQMSLAANDSFLSEEDLTRMAVGIGEDFAARLENKVVSANNWGELGVG